MNDKTERQHRTLPRRGTRSPVLNWHMFTHMELALFRSLVTRIEREINTTTQEITGEIETIELQYGEETQEVTIVDGLDDTTWDLDNIFRVHFPNVQRSAYVITLYSFLETSMVELCNHFHDEMGLNIRQSDMNGKGIRRCNNYLSKVIGLNFREIEREWLNIDNLGKIRNIIVHRDRDIAEDDVAMLAYIRKNEHLDIDRSHNLIVQENFLMSMLIDMEVFVNAVDRLIRALPQYTVKSQ